jgi:hypothetical protein
MFERSIARGMRAVLLDPARVHHKVESFRLRKRYLRRWRIRASRNIAQCRGVQGERRFLNIPLFLYPLTARAIIRMIAGDLSQPGDEAFHRELIVCHFSASCRACIDRAESQ